MQLLRVEGMLIKNFNVNSNSFDLDLSYLTNGLYYIRIESMVQKIIIQ